MTEKNPNQLSSERATPIEADTLLTFRPLDGDSRTYSGSPDTAEAFPSIDDSLLDANYIITPAQTIGNEEGKHITISGNNPKIPDAAHRVTTRAIETDERVLGALAPDFTLLPEYSAHELKPVASWQDPVPKPKANEKKTLFQRIFG